MAMENFVCKFCNINYESYHKESKFCSLSCKSKYHYDNNLRNRPAWNKGTSGIMKKNKTSFKKGDIPYNKLPLGTIRVRTDKQMKRNWIKVSKNKWELLYRHVWEQENGKIPNGYVIHHKDFNSLNDKIENLEVVTRKNHINIHREDLIYGKI
jgi:hypothetical protein